MAAGMTKRETSVAARPSRARNWAGKRIALTGNEKWYRQLTKLLARAGAEAIRLEMGPASDVSRSALGVDAFILIPDSAENTADVLRKIAEAVSAVRAVSAL